MARKKTRELTCGRLQDELVKGQAFATSLGDSGTGGFGKAKGGHREFGDLVDALVVSHGRHDNCGAVAAGLTRHHLRLVVQMLDQLGKRNWCSVNPRRHESAQHGLAETRAGSAGQELEELNEQVVVQVLALGVFLRSVLYSTSSN